MAIGVISSGPGGGGNNGGSDVSLSAGQTGDSVSSFSFDKLHEQAVNYEEGSTPDTQEQVVEPVTEPTTQEEVVAEPQAEVTEVATTSAKKLAQLADDDLVEIEVDGVKETMPWKEARGFTMRQSKFTKSMQDVAKQRKAIEDQQATVRAMGEEREALVTLLKDENLLKQFIGKRYPALLKAQAQVEEAARTTDPGDIATVEQIENARHEFADTMNGLVDSLKNELTRRDEALVERIQDAQTVVKLQGEIRTTVDSLFEAHPYLKVVIPNAEQNLRYEVAKLDPRTPEATIEAFKHVFGGWVESYKNSVAATSKKQVIEKHKLETNNVKPAKGAAQVQPQPETYLTKNRAGRMDVDWKAMNKTALEMLNKK